MKHLKTSPRIIVALAAALFSAQLEAATPIWNAASGGNWSVNGNWSTGIFPQTIDDVQFGNTGAGNQNTMDAAFAINSLTYGQDNGLTHTTLLNPGLTLSINRGTAGDVLNVGSATAATGANTLVRVAIQGPGSTLSLNGAGDLVIRQGNGTAGSHMATLDLSGLDTFTANVGHLFVGVTGGGVNRPSGTLILAKTNTLTLTGAVSATVTSVMVQDSTANANGGTVSLLSLGQVNFFYADQYRFGGQKGNGNVQFNLSFSNPSLVIRNVDQVSRASLLVCADNSISGSGNSATANVDLTPGTFDGLVDTVYIAKGNIGGSGNTGAATGTFGFSAGTFDINTLEIGFQTANVVNGVTTGTMLVNNNGLITTNNSIVSIGAVLKVNTTMRLARTNGSPGAVTGALTVNGGTVMANNIVAGGGNSTITLFSGSSLIVSNSAGTLANPIRNFSINDASLTLPALNGGTVLAVSNLVAGGSQNVINISSVPPIGSYPATFTLISYRSGAGGNFVIGSLPAGYTGTIVDTGNGVVQLKLTAGPLVDLSILWTAATDNNWDLTTFNWNYKGSPSNFFAGATPIFNDTAAQPIVNLATSISSGTVTVNNDVLQYDFTGAGNIAGASSLVKNGSQTLIIDNVGVDNFGSVAINAGTLQIGAGDVNGDISTLNITDNSALVVNRSGTIGLSSAIAGSGSLTKLGNGTLTLSGASTYSGTTTLSAGNLQVDGALSGGGALTTASSTLLSGSGTVSGPVTVSGSVNPGTVGAPGTLTGGGAFTLASGSALTFDLSGPNFSTPSANDSITVGGNLSLNNNAVTANFLGIPSVGAQYPLVTYSGSLSGGFNPAVTGSHFTMVLDTVSAPGTVLLQITGGEGANLKWNGADQNWDSLTPNWTDLGTSASSQFYSGDTVLFDDSSGVQAITIGSAVYPSAVTNISDNNNFVFSGSGKISGTAGIVKGGNSSLTINTANDFTGLVDIQAGTLKTGNPTALGSATVGTTVEAGATLDMNGQGLSGEAITIAGQGVNNAGAVINTGGAVVTAMRTLVLSSNASIGGTSTWAVNNAGGAASLVTGGQPYKLTKVGTGQIGLQNLSSVDPALGDIEIQQGILEFNGLTPNMGDVLHTNIVDAGATLQFANNSVVWNKFFNFTGNGVASTVNNNAGASTELAGAVELHGSVIFNVGGTAMTISGPISGDGGLTKIGATAMVLTNNETYTGDTHINGGVMRLAGTASISNSPNIFIAQGATLTVTGRVDATFTLLNGQNLSGNGTIAGSLVTTAGSTVSPGTNTIGILTVSNTITLGGTTFMDLDQNNKTNDVLFCNSAITYGGTLQLTTTNQLTNGASFKLFKAGSYSGAFANIVPTAPGSGLAWNTNTLSTGVISVVPGPVTGPTTNATITSAKASGTNLLIHGVNNNVPNTSFHYAVLTSTNLTLPLSNWTAVVTNSFNPDGTFDYTNPIVPGTPRQFIDVKAVP
jgi:fibronectin-binding autotransporter adhesin